MRSLEKRSLEPGGMAEWTKAAVLKTAVGQPTGGSNPSPSAFGSKPQSVERRTIVKSVGYFVLGGGAGVADRGRLLSACRG